ncbi:MAG TPA: O-antigen ligase family protein [Nitrospiraceae bacterium]|jgi:hypothetical protein
MNGFTIVFLLVAAAAMLTLPRRWGALPLMMAACYLTRAQHIMVGPFHFTVLRLLLLLGVFRAMARHERLPGGITGLDRVILIWGGWMLCSGAFHRPFTDALVERSGIVYDGFGIYFLLRLFCQNKDDMIRLIKITAFVLVPVALEMINEKVTGRNLFAFLGGVPEAVEMRDGKLRAQGPFGHSILAGTVGAVCVPLMIGIWREHARVAKIGLAACLAMVIASNSSGPIMSLAFGVFALILWRWRHLTRQMRIAAVVGYILLDIVMKDPAYFLMARIDLTGSSTGYHRAQLIRSAFQHLSEWWSSGTDFTLHWMPYGVSWSPNHCDITNHYLSYGVQGGLPLMMLFIFELGLAFYYVGQSLRLRAETSSAHHFLIWSLGSGLFAHAVTCVSVSYFEQSITFLYLNLAVIGSLQATALAEARDAPSVFGSESSDGHPEREAANVLPSEDDGHLPGSVGISAGISS